MFSFLKNEVSKIFDSNKKEIGIRIPDNNIAIELVKALGNPIASTSLHNDDEILEYFADPYAIYEKYDEDVDLIIDGGFGKLDASTIVDCTSALHRPKRKMRQKHIKK